MRYHQNMENVLFELHNYLRSNKKDSLNSLIATYMIANYNEVVNMKLAEVAEQCHVSTPSIIRFCREIGCKDFSDYKESIKTELNIMERYPLDSNDVSLSLDSASFENNLINLIRSAWQSEEEIFKQINKEQLRYISMDIVAYRYIYCISYGISTLFGEYLNSRLLFQGKSIISIGEPNYDKPMGIDPKRTLAIVVSQKGGFIENNERMLKYIKKYSDQVILITQAQNLKVNKKYFDKIFYLPEAETTQQNILSLLILAEIFGQQCMKYYIENK